jgi:hypothetical protein
MDGRLERVSCSLNLGFFTVSRFPTTFIVSSVSLNYTQDVVCATEPEVQSLLV